MPRTPNKEKAKLISELIWRGHTHQFIAKKLGLERSSISYYIKNNADEFLDEVSNEDYDKARLMLQDGETSSYISETLELPLSIVFLIKKQVLGYKKVQSTRHHRRKIKLKCLKCGLAFRGYSQSDCPYCHRGE